MAMKYETYGKIPYYKKWLETEGIDVVEGYSVDDVNTIPLKPWNRKGGKGVYINLVGAEDSNHAYICEIPSGEVLKPQKHLFEEMIFILEGAGATEVWNEGQSKQKFEWQKGSLFSIPLNAWHQHFNSHKNRPAKYLAVTDAPAVIDLFHNLDFIFNNNYIFRDRFNGEANYFSGEGKLYQKKCWDSNFIPNVYKFKLFDYKERGPGATNAKFDMADNVMESHVSEMPVGTYKKAHRHSPGAHVLILNGKGYTLMWKEGQPMQKFDWHTGSFLVPPRDWFHQHFNTGKEPAKYLALRWGSKEFLTGLHFTGAAASTYTSIKLGGGQLEYEDEDPEVRRLYMEELAKDGLELMMPDVIK